jgi:hypothetical protein
VLAGEIAQRLIDQGTLDEGDVPTAVERGWQAVAALVKLDRPSQA